MISLYNEWKEEKNNNNKKILTCCHISFFFYSNVNIWVTEENQKRIYTVLKMTSLKLNKHGTLLQCKPQKKTTQSGNGNLSLLISMNSTMIVHNEKCLLWL